MKALVITTPETTKIVYCWHDDEFKEHLSNISKSLSRENFSFETHILMYFSPLVTSYSTLKSKLDEACSVIECEDGKMTVLFEQHQQFLYVGLDQSSPERKDTLFREMSYLKASIGLLFGPCGHYQLNTPHVKLKRRSWSKVSAMMDSYAKLCSTDHTFLMEAVEKLRVSDDDVSKVCSEVIQKCVKHFQAIQHGRNLQYVMIFVGAKLLAFHMASSIASDLSTCSLLQIISLISSKISNKNTVRDSSQSYDSCSHSSASDSEAYSVDSPAANSSNDLSKDNKSQFTFDLDDDMMLLKTDMDFIFDMTTQLSPDTCSSSSPNPQSPGSKSGERHDSDAGSTDLSDSSEANEPAQGALSVDEDYFSSGEESDMPAIREDSYQVPIFLSTSKSPSVPHMLHCVPIVASPAKLNMVFVSKVNKVEISDVICGMLYWLRKIKFHDDELEIVGGMQTVKNLSMCNRKIVEKTRKNPLKKVKAYGKKITDTWNHNGQKKLNASLAEGTVIDVNLLEKCVNEMEHCLHVLFKKLFPSCVDDDFSGKADRQHKNDGIARQKSHTERMQKIQHCAKRKLNGYIDYLSVKSQQNITMASYLKEYPGMVHFAFVRRSRFFEALSGTPSMLQNDTFGDELFAPSIVSSNSLNIGMSLRNNFWSFFYHTYSEAVKGKLFLEVEYEDFIFTSYIWFADKDRPSQPLDVSKTAIPDHMDAYKSPSIFSGEFYMDFLRSSSSVVTGNLLVFHLVCIHFTVVPREIIMNHHKRLFNLAINDLT